MPHALGDEVRIVMSKWGGRPHWEFDALYLGSDLHGDWLGVPQGTRMARPGATYVAPTHQACLVPPPGQAAERGWLCTFHDVGGPLRAYVDITTPPAWTGSTVHAVDLDLDVLLGTTGRAWVDDEDEFADHRVRFGYPEDVVRAATASCDRVHALVAAGVAPYDGTAGAWLARLANLLAS